VVRCSLPALHGQGNADRPQLAACKKQKAKLVIAKLDRLSRNVAFIANLA
jgi:DNA invertase Pin-like site-specific DNA recombinase